MTRCANPRTCWAASFVASAVLLTASVASAQIPNNPVLTSPGRELKLQTRLNGEVVQSSHTGHMIFPIPRLINYASTIFTLVPGDVIVTGTPAGVGWSKKPPRFMRPGDVVEVEIEAVGLLHNPIVAQD